VIGLCHCGHALETHFEKKETCLGVLCECPTFRDSEKPDPRPLARSYVTVLDYDPSWDFPVIKGS